MGFVVDKVAWRLVFAKYFLCHILHLHYTSHCLTLYNFHTDSAIKWQLFRKKRKDQANSFLLWCIVPVLLVLHSILIVLKDNHEIEHKCTMILVYKATETVTMEIVY